MRITNAVLSAGILLLGLMLMVPLTSTQAETPDGNQIFSEAVQAVKERDYTRALNLFEKQATNARHDAQYSMAVLLQAGKGRPRNYSTALYWSWLAKLGGIEEADDIANDMLDALSEDDVKAVRTRVGETLQARLDNGDIKAIPQFANYHLSILEEPDHGTAYIWYSIAVALNIPDMIDVRDNTESDIETKDLARCYKSE